MDEVIRIYLEGWCWVEVIGEESLEHVLVVLAEDRSNVLRFFLVLYIFASLISDSSCIFEATGYQLRVELDSPQDLPLGRIQ